jgi:hypothetical protein
VISPSSDHPIPFLLTMVFNEQANFFVDDPFSREDLGNTEDQLGMGISVAESQMFLLDLCLIRQFSVIGNALGAGFIFLLPLRVVFLYQFNEIFIGFHMYQCTVFMHHPTAYLAFVFFPFHGSIRTRLEMSSIYPRGSAMSRKSDLKRPKKLSASRI